MVENFGSYLKHERELRGVPLEEISGTTKIHIRFLRALEENSFDELPGEVFIKGYIRSYANTIGSDVEEMLNIYKESAELRDQKNLPQEASSFSIQPKTLLAYGLSVLVVAGLLFGVGFLMKSGTEDSSGKLEEKKASSLQTQAKVVDPEPLMSDLLEEPLVEENMGTQEESPADLEAPELSNPISSSDQPTEDVNEEQASSLLEPVELMTPGASMSDWDAQNSADIEKPLKLSIHAKEISWFNMTIDNSREEDFILPAGTSKTFWGNEMIRLTVGNKTGVELFLNGKSIALPESKDKVVKDFFINSKLVD